MKNIELDKSLLTHAFVEPRKTKLFGSQEVVGGKGIKIKLTATTFAALTTNTYTYFKENY